MDVTTNVLGAVAELAFAKAALLKGYAVFSPMVPTQRDYDFVVEFPEGLKKVQVKKATVREVERSTIVGVSMNGSANRAYSENAYDYLAATCLELDRIWLFPKKAITVTQTLCKSINKLSDWDEYIF